MKKLPAFLLALSLLFSLSACQKDGRTDSDIPAYVTEYTQALAGVDPDTVMFTVNGVDVSAEFFFYWLSYDCYAWNMTSLYNSGSALDFDAAVSSDSDTTFAQYIKDDARQITAVYCLLEEQAAARGLGATEEQRKEWEDKLASYREESSEESFLAELRRYGISPDVFSRISIINSYLYGNLVSGLVSTPTTADLDAYCEEQQIYRAKHILIRTVTEAEDGTLSFFGGSGTPTNEDGTPFTGTAEEYNAAVKAKVDSLLEQLAAAEDLSATFDRLMNEYSEDTGLTYYPDGYTFGPNEMMAEFEAGVKALSCDAYSTEPVQTSYGYHIILRLRPDVTDEYTSKQLGVFIEDWLSQADIVTTAAYDALDVKSFYTNYTAFQEALKDEAAAATADPSNSPDPSPSPTEK